MSFGLPCPDEMKPQEVFSSVQQYDDILGSFAASVMSEIQRAKVETQGLIGPALNALEQRVRQQLAQINRILGDVYELLRTNVNSGTFQLNAQLASTITDISSTLQTTTEEVMYGTSAQPPSQQPFPPATSPVRPGLPLPVAPGYQPDTNPFPGTAYPQSPGQPPLERPEQTGGQELPTRPTLSGVPTATQLVSGGLPVLVSVACPPVPISNPVAVGNGVYTPTITVYNTGTILPPGQGGTPTVVVSYDQQPDGSIAVHIGPISVVVSMPSADPSANDPPCPLAVG